MKDYDFLKLILQAPPGHAGLWIGFAIIHLLRRNQYILHHTQIPAADSSHINVRQVPQIINGIVPVIQKTSVTTAIVVAMMSQRSQAKRFWTAHT